MKKLTPAEKRAETIRKNKAAKEERNRKIAEKRLATIAAKNIAKEKEIKRKHTIKVLKSINGTKPIFWIFFLFGWVNALYWLFVIVKYLLTMIGIG